MKTFTNLAHRAFKKCASLGTINKKRYYLFIITMLLTLGVGNAWAEEVSIDFSQKNYSNQQAITDVTITEGINAKFEKGSNSNPPKYYTSGTAIRAYGGNTFTISSTIGNITQIDLTFGSSDGSNAITTDAGNFSSPTWTGDANSVKFTIAGSSGNRRIKAIKVTYTPSTGGGEDSGEGGGEDPVDPTPGIGGTVTYTVSSVTEVTTTGNVPQGSTAVLSGTGSLNSGFIQCTNGKNHTLTLTGYEGYMITGVTIHVKSNSSKGTGSFSVMAGSTAIASITESAFNTSSWNGSWNTTGVDKTLTMTNDSYEIQSGENVTLTINCKSGSSNYNSLYVKSYTITYIPVTSSGGGTEEPVPSLTQDQFSWSATTATATLPNTFDNQPNLKNTEKLAVSYSSSNEDVAKIDASGNVTLVGVGTADIKATAGGEGTTFKETTVYYTLTVKKAPATPTDNVYVKVTTTAGITDGEYLIVYEDAASENPAPVAFDGSLTTLDAVSNNIAVKITDGTIAGNTHIDAATFTIDATAKTIKSASGQYIGRTAYDNGLDSKIEVLTNTIEISNGNAVITASGNCVLRYNSTSGQYRFRYYKSGQQPIALYKKAYTITIKESTNGSVSASVSGAKLETGAKVLSGTTITLGNTPATGHELAAYDVYKTGEESAKIIPTDGKFVMPEYNVTISATFQLKSYEVKATANPSEGGTVTGADTYKHGESVTLKATANTGYEFVNWTEGGTEVSKAAEYTFTPTEDVSLVANFQLNQYTVKFLNYDDEVLQSSQVEHGAMPQYNETTPERPADAQYTYAFSGWDPEIAVATSNQTYTAQFDATVNKYTITFNNWDGTTLATYEVEYGQTPVYADEAPTKAATDQYTYTFSGWDPEIAAVTGEATYTATYSQTLNQYTITATATNGTVTGAETYTHGAKVTLTADPAMDYTFVSWIKGGEVVSTANPFVFEATENLDLVANFKAIPERTTDLTGTFSVGQYEVAQFATGNLQYTNGTWGFAKQQYQYVGEANINVGDPTFTGTIDMFGWSTNETTYGVDPRNLNELYDGEFVDWGDLFPVEDNWSTLSADQWKYLLNTRPNASSLKQIARVGSVVGIMLFPDNWNAPLTVTAQHDSYFDVNIHNYTLDQWAELEEAGALFLPAAGRRAGGYGNMINKDQVEETNSANLNGGHYKHQDNTNIYCYYWTSTIDEDKNVSYLHNIVALGNDEYTIGTGAIWGEKGRYGQSVRLAKVTSTLIEIGDDDNSAVITANAGKEMDVQVNRTFKANNGYYTICLPFNLDAEKIGTALQISSVTENVAEQGMNVVFTEVTNLVAGQPYLVLPSEDLTNPIFENVTIVNTQGSNYTVTGADVKVTFTGIINGSGTTNGSTEYYVGNGGYLYNGTVDKLGLRAFFTITDEAGNPTKVRARVVTREDTVTGFENITNGENTTIKLIENGQLIIIRNGEKFNAQGIKL